MKSLKNNKNITSEFEDLFSFENPEDTIELDAKLISAKFLSLVQKELDVQNIKRKDLAKLVGTSSSYITQLFRGDKLLNLTFIAKIQSALKLEFEISSSHHFEHHRVEHIGEFLDKWYENRPSNEYIKLTKAFNDNEVEYKSSNKVNFLAS